MPGEKRIQLPTGEVVSFPDTMGDDAIASAIGRNFPPQQNEAGLSPDVEALRQRNMANAMRNVGGIAGLTQRGRDVQSDIEGSQMHPLLKALLGLGSQMYQAPLEAANQAFHGNPVGASMGDINAAAQNVFTPISAINEAVKQIPSVGAPIAQYNPLALLAQGSGALGQQFVTPLLPTGGQTPEQQAYTQSQRQQLGSNAGQLAGGELIGALVPGTQDIAQRGAARIEGAAQKPPYVAAKGIDQFDRQIQTTLKENLSPTRGGLKKVQGLLQDLDNTAEPLKKQATDNGVKVNFNDFSKYLDQSKGQYANDADFVEKSAAIDGMKARVESLAKQYPNGEVPFDAAWRFKKTLQDMVGGKYDQDPNTTGYSKEAAKSAAHGLLDDMLTKVPDLREIGLRQRDLIEAQNMMSRRVAAQSKADILTRRGVRAVGAGLIGAHYGGVEGALGAGAAELIGESPTVQHGVAVALDRLANLGKSKIDPYAGYTPRPFSPSSSAPASPTGGTISPNPPTPTQTGAPPPTSPPSAPAVPTGGTISPNPPTPTQTGAPPPTSPPSVPNVPLSTNGAVAAGANASPGDVKQVWQNYLDGTKLPRVRENLIPLQNNQFNREFVEGYLAKAANRPHRAMSQSEIESALKTLKIH